MRVITGTARGRKLLSPIEVTRPTSEKVKEAIFSSIQFELIAANVLDLFAGSGQLGIEALSRGAKFAQFVDADRENIEIIRKNIENCGFESVSKVALADARTFLRKIGDKFNFAFLDPPYGRGLLNDVLPLVSEIMLPGGKVICEHEKEFKFEDYGSLKIFKTYSYGKVIVTTFIKYD